MTVRTAELVAGIALILVSIALMYKSPDGLIFVLCIVGGYAPEQSLHDLWLMLLFGVVGYLLRKLDYPLAPAVLAIVLGPLAEQSLRQSLLMSQGEMSIFFTRPLSLTFLICGAALFCSPFVIAWRRRRERPAAVPESAE